MREPLIVSRKFYRNDDGMVLLTIIILTIILSVLVIGIMSISVSHVKSGQNLVETIRREELAKGVFYQYQQCRLNGEGTTPEQMEIDGRTYDIVVTDEGTEGSPNATSRIRVDITNVSP